MSARCRGTVVLCGGERKFWSMVSIVYYFFSFFLHTLTMDEGPGNLQSPEYSAVLCRTCCPGSFFFFDTSRLFFLWSHRLVHLTAQKCMLLVPTCANIMRIFLNHRRPEGVPLKLSEIFKIYACNTHVAMVTYTISR